MDSMDKAHLLQLIIDYGKAKDAQGQAFIDTRISAATHAAYCEVTVTLFTKIVDALDAFEVRPF